MEIGELEKYVQANPADHEQRWRLAKRLYKACEYERALEHLLTVRDGWYRKLNVMRYVAATFYRLGRIEEAVAELEKACQYWPRDLGAREQLARMLELAGRREEAAKAWDRIAEQDPKHPLAEKAAKRLRSNASGANEPIRIPDSDSGIGLVLGWACPNCGAQNSDDFDRCWQCHATNMRRTPTPKPIPKGEARADAWLWTLITGLLAVGFICWGLFLVLTHMPGLNPEGGHAEVPESVTKLLDGELFAARVVAGLLLLVAWPLGLLGLLRLVGTPEVPVSTVVLTGLMSAACAFVTLWASPTHVAYAMMAPAGLSLIVIAAGFRIGLWRAPLVWLMQCACAFGLVLACAGISEGSAFIREFPRIVAAARQFERPDASKNVYAIPGKTPFQARLAWPGSGSSWLDGAAREVTLEIVTQEGAPALLAELLENDQSVRFVDVDSASFRLKLEVVPGHTYEIRVTGREGVPLELRVHTLLPSELEQARPQPGDGARRP